MPKRMTIASIAVTALLFVVLRTQAQMQTTVNIQGSELPVGSGWDTGTITITVNGSYQKTVQYGFFSTAAGIASSFGGLFPRIRPPR